jgi:hypothetical protein
MSTVAFFLRKIYLSSASFPTRAVVLSWKCHSLRPFALIIPQYKTPALASGLGDTSFVKAIFELNRKQLKRVKRPEVDRVWAQMLPKWMPHDPCKCRRLLAEV